MIGAIDHVASVQPLDRATGSAANGDFSGMMRTAIDNVEAGSAQAGKLTESFLSGGPVDLHTVALAAQKASLQFDLFMQARNKVVNAYQEIMRMQV